MKIETYDDKRSVQILAGMIMNSQVLGKIAGYANGNGKRLFDNPWCNIVAPILLQYYERYDKAPKRKVAMTLLQAWGEKTRDQSSVDGINKLWGALQSDLDKDINSDFLVDVAGTYFTDVKIKRAIDLAQGYKDSGKQKEALEALQSCSKVEMGNGALIDVLQDEVEIRGAFSTENETIIQYAGALGDIFRYALEREGFVAFCAPEKRGKTWWLLDMAWRAMCQRKRVLFFEVGDMSKRQLVRRLMARAAKRPTRSPTGQWPCVIRYPVGLRSGEVETRDKTYNAPVDGEKAVQACMRVMQDERKSEKRYFCLSVHAPFSITARQIRDEVKKQIRGGWQPDVVVIDYADILAPPPGKADTRDKYDVTWGTLRGIAGEFGCMVLTATQANRKAYDIPLIKMEHMSEDKRKLAHATVMYGINVKPEERQKGLCRINCFAAREKDHNENHVVHVAGCLPLGNPAILSEWGERR